MNLARKWQVTPLINEPKHLMFDFYRDMPWFLKVHCYDNQKQLIADLGERVILPAETKAQELRRKQRV